MSIPKEPEQVMKMRGGSVLGKRTILKSDHFPGCQNKRLTPQIDGAPNYRQADSLRVHGVAIPTIEGILNVLKYIGAQKDGKKVHVLWISLREEPVVYINGRPFVLREAERPFSNLEYTGINRARVEQMEARLKEDILMEAARYGNKILVTDELPDGQMVDQWEPVFSDSVKTPLDVYEELQVEGYLVDYERVPVTDEKSPKEQDFDILVDKISQANLNTEVIFNCQMGRGRTTTGMVIATLVYLNRIGASGIPRTNSVGRVFDSGSNVADRLPNSEEAVRRGEYAVIRSLIRVLEGGVEGKRQVDKVIDKCASMQNLREAIASYRSSIRHQPDEMKREASLSFFVEYLERYYFLICFAVYLHSERAALHSSSFSHSSFVDWMKARPELYSIIRRLLRRDPMGALEYANSKPSVVKIAESADGCPHDTDVVAAMRNGQVLGSQTVLKSDHCPGCQNTSLPERVEGAPNFRQVPGFSVYGVANPTIDGIRSVIRRIGNSEGCCPVFWHNMREEPVIYINGKPFVLREVERPCKNMLEYTMGRGRTTTGTVIACLLKLRIDHGRPIKILHDDVVHEELDSGSSSGEETGGNGTTSTPSAAKVRTEIDGGCTFGMDDILLLWKITRLFDNGVECREALDSIIDRCSALQNIREAVLEYRKIFNQQHVEPRDRRLALNRGAEYLERYFRLIAFAAYLGSESFDGFCGQGESKMTFKTWLRQRPEVQAMKWSIRLRPGRFFTVPEELRAPHESQHGDAVMEAIVKNRNGSVLGKGSILKMYFFPGQRTSSHLQVHGAPHVFKVDGYPVYSMATPTIVGAKEMLAYLGAKPKAEGSISQKVILTDLREEAVVYINGTPFVLRELSKPVDTLKHVGITGPVVEHMEARLKEDILSEIRLSGGRMLLHREEYNPALNQSSVIGYWENIFVDDVKSPAEVYASLKADGYNITHRRIPLTRERDALASDVDAIQYCRDESAGCYLFVSHTGFGGVAYAMAILCLRLDAEEKLASNVPQPLVGPHLFPAYNENLPSRASDKEALQMGDYRDILSLTRVLVYGPQSKADVDIVIERCAGAGHLRDDILHFSEELQKFPNDDDEQRAYLMDMGIKALRRYFFLITFRSYLYCTSPAETKFKSWMDGRPELGHLCNNLRIDK
ncbi:paladin-like isoform X3 [Mangifera indica]|uniref:paladin-like isoform X3 n=1 Tax=Mangifera indica TaxID=29780 RepID=UPI001CF9F202|nr:paladin-like isoform X3 [Mangifera indica]